MNEPKNNRNQNIFGGGDELAEAKTYSTAELLKCRKSYYFLCAAFLILILLVSILIPVLIKKDGRKYNSYPHITKREEQLNRNENHFFIYYYQETCSACSTIKSDVFDFVDTNIKKQDPAFVFYFADVVALFPSPETPTTDFIGIDDASKLYVHYTPLLLEIGEQKVTNQYLGTSQILDRLSK